MNRRFSAHIRICAAVSALWAAFVLAGLPCPLRALTGVPCPTCGCTRALAALLRQDVAAYWQLQPLALPLAASVLICLHLRVLRPRMRRAAGTLAGVVLAANALLYALRLCG